MFSFNIDLGQIIIAGLIGIVGYFFKRTIDEFKTRIDKHEDILFKMNGDLQLLVGNLGIERRSRERNR